jgi:hypothetical protein
MMQARSVPGRLVLLPEVLLELLELLALELLLERVPGQELPLVLPQVLQLARRLGPQALLGQPPLGLQGQLLRVLLERPGPARKLPC